MSGTGDASMSVKWTWASTPRVGGTPARRAKGGFRVQTTSVREGDEHLGGGDRTDACECKQLGQSSKTRRRSSLSSSPASRAPARCGGRASEAQAPSRSASTS